MCDFLPDSHNLIELLSIDIHDLKVLVFSGVDKHLGIRRNVECDELCITQCSTDSCSERARISENLTR